MIKQLIAGLVGLYSASCGFAGEVVFQEVTGERNPCQIIVLSQFPAEGCFYESQYSICLDEEYVDNFDAIMDSVLDKIEGDRVYYTLFTCILGDSKTKELLPWFTRKWENIEERFPFFPLLRNVWSEEIAYSGWGSKDSYGDGSNASARAQPFFTLPLTIEDKKNIRFIISSMGEKNLVQILMEKSEMENKGALIEGVHPMRFLGFILSDVYLRKSLKKVEKDSFKWSYFIDGFKEKMKDLHAVGQLSPYVPGFAELLGMQEEHIEMLLQQKNYDNFVKSLLSLY